MIMEHRVYTFTSTHITLSTQSFIFSLTDRGAASYYFQNRHSFGMTTGTGVFFSTLRPRFCLSRHVLVTQPRGEQSGIWAVERWGWVEFDKLWSPQRDGGLLSSADAYYGCLCAPRSRGSVNKPWEVSCLPGCFSYRLSSVVTDVRNVKKKKKKLGGRTGHSPWLSGKAFITARPSDKAEASDPPT